MKAPRLEPARVLWVHWVCRAIKITFEQIHGVQLEGNAGFFGEEVDSAAGLRQEVQVELKAHGAGEALAFADFLFSLEIGGGG